MLLIQGCLLPVSPECKGGGGSTRLAGWEAAGQHGSSSLSTFMSVNSNDAFFESKGTFKSSRPTFDFPCLIFPPTGEGVLDEHNGFWLPPIHCEGTAPAFLVSVPDASGDERFSPTHQSKNSAPVILITMVKNGISVTVQTSHHRFSRWALAAERNWLDHKMPCSRCSLSHLISQSWKRYHIVSQKAFDR